mgnify:CR=1 FL=1
MNLTIGLIEKDCMRREGLLRTKNGLREGEAATFPEHAAGILVGKQIRQGSRRAK